MRLFLLLCCAAVALFPRDANATIVKLDTPIGSMTFQLFDEAKPVTVSNFLNYITSGRYTNTFAHRLIPGFIMQGGYAGYNGGLFGVSPYAAIVNEAGPFPQYSNVFGTISMAKVPPFDDDGDPIPGGGPDSATSQWFINMGDNSANLDNQNGGFTVFASILSGMDVLQTFAAFTYYTKRPSSNVVTDQSQIDSNFASLPAAHMDGTTNLYVNDLIFTTWSVVPEPSTTALIIVAGLGVFAVRRSFRPAPARVPGGPALR